MSKLVACKNIPHKVSRFIAYCCFKILVSSTVLHSVYAVFSLCIYLSLKATGHHSAYSFKTVARWRTVSAFNRVQFRLRPVALLLQLRACRSSSIYAACCVFFSSFFFFFNAVVSMLWQGLSECWDLAQRLRSEVPGINTHSHTHTHTHTHQKSGSCVNWTWDLECWHLAASLHRGMGGVWRWITGTKHLRAWKE